MEICPVCQEHYLDPFDPYAGHQDKVVFYCSPCDIEYHAYLAPDLRNAKRIYNWSKTEEGKRICSDWFGVVGKGK